MPSSGKTGEICTVSGVYQADCGPGHTHRIRPGRQVHALHILPAFRDLDLDSLLVGFPAKI